MASEMMASTYWLEQVIMSLNRWRKQNKLRRGRPHTACVSKVSSTQPVPRRPENGSVPWHIPKLATRTDIPTVVVAAALSIPTMEYVCQQVWLTLLGHTSVCLTSLFGIRFTFPNRVFRKRCGEGSLPTHTTSVQLNLYKYYFIVCRISMRWYRSLISLMSILQVRLFFLYITYISFEMSSFFNIYPSLARKYKF